MDPRRNALTQALLRLAPNVARALAIVLGIAGALPGAASDWWPQRQSAQPQLLTADQAFALVSAEHAGDRVQVTWSIAPGYYLYRKRLGFAAAAPADGKLLGAPALPAASIIHDAHEGDAEIYRGTLVASVPLRKGAASPRQLRVSYQGCADVGVCYPPQSKLIDIVPIP